jgi:hypothetical protein
MTLYRLFRSYSVSEIFFLSDITVKFYFLYFPLYAYIKFYDVNLIISDIKLWYGLSAVRAGNARSRYERWL